MDAPNQRAPHPVPSQGEGIIRATAITLVALLALAGVGATTDKPRKSEFLKVSSRTYTPPDTCVESQRAITYYRRSYTATRHKMRAAGAVPRVWYHQCKVVRRRATEWRDRAGHAREALGDWIDYHYNWRKWLPGNWYVVGRCETGYGGAPNWNHSNSSFVSAFGISRSIYDYDARLAGTPPWNDAHPPTPREQLLTAQAHYNRFGDGWGCPGP